MKIFTRRSKPPLPADEALSEPDYLAGHILMEAVHADGLPTTSPDPEALERTADDQRHSAFLRLPIEVWLRIYDIIFADAGLTQHVYIKEVFSPLRLVTSPAIFVAQSLQVRVGSHGSRSRRPTYSYAVLVSPTVLQADTSAAVCCEGVEAPPKLPWHGRASAWQQLRDRLSELENFRRLDVWLDAADQLSRCRLVSRGEAFSFDARLVLFKRVSVPLDQTEDGRYYPIDFELREVVFGRGMAEFWQALEVAPEITWFLGYRSVRLYDRPEDYNSCPVLVGHRRGGRSLIEHVRMCFGRLLRQ